jgi:hypothetical protein
MSTVLIIFEKITTLTENDTNNNNLLGFLKYYNKTFVDTSYTLYEISDSVKKLSFLHGLVPEVLPITVTSKKIEDLFHSRPVNIAHGINQYLKILSNTSNQFLPTKTENSTLLSICNCKA